MPNFRFCVACHSPSPCLIRLVLLRWLGSSAISGTLPNSLYFLSILIQIDLPETRLSGTISVNVSQLESLRSFNIGNPVGRSSFSGSIPHSFSGAAKLEFLVINRLPMLQFDLNLIATWPELIYAVISETAVNSAIPTQFLQNSSRLKSLLMVRHLFALC